MAHIFTLLFGYAAAVVGTVLMLPQVYKSYKTKRMNDISWGMVVLYVLNCALWLGYGILIGATPVSLTNAIGLIIATVQIALKVRYSKNPTPP